MLFDHEFNRTVYLRVCTRIVVLARVVRLERESFENIFIAKLVKRKPRFVIRTSTIVYI